MKVFLNHSQALMTFLIPLSVLFVFSPIWAQTVITPAASPKTNSLKTQRAQEFLDMAKAYEQKGLIRKAHEYFEIARQLDPSISDKGGSSKVSSTPDINPMKTGISFDFPQFKPDPNRPYNSMVKGLYEEALESYSSGNTYEAVGFLKKAQQVDPSEPQVQNLLEKIQGPDEKPSDPLEKIKTDLKNGDQEQASVALQDYLGAHPNDGDALELKSKLEASANSPPPAKRPSKKSKKKHNKTTLMPSNEKDQEAQADQAYNLGLDSYRQGDFATAKKFWEQTLAIQPNHPQAQRNLQRLTQEHPELESK